MSAICVSSIRRTILYQARSIIFILFIVSESPLFAEEKTNKVLVTTNYGKVEGVIDGTSKHYRGIPYAKPPTGELRWQPPQVPDRWPGTRDASDYGAICPQKPRSKNSLPISEDCLTLNISVPATVTGSSKLPVVVEIHGGGFVKGSGADVDLKFAGTWNNKSIILVTFNYRLGALGFFSDPELHKGIENQNVSSSVANYGLLDMIAALRWVNGNIQQFGGDVSRITISGVSAGGMSVNMLMVMPEAKGLFSRAIAQSGYGTWPLPRIASLSIDSSPIAEDVSQEIINRVRLNRNVSPDLDLRSTPAKYWVEAVEGFHLPVVDGVTLPEEPGILFARGEQHPVNFITGGNSFDGSVYPYSGISSEAFLSMFDDLKLEVRMLYQEDFSVNNNRGISRLFGDTRYVFSAAYLAEKASAKQSVYLYYLDYVPELMKKQWPGAPHALEVVLMHGNNGDLLAYGITENSIGIQMRNYWANFIKSGDPNGEDLPHWPQVEKGNKFWLVFNNQISIKQGILGEKLSILEAVYQARISNFMYGQFNKVNSYDLNDFNSSNH